MYPETSANWGEVGWSLLYSVPELSSSPTVWLGNQLVGNPVCHGTLATWWAEQFSEWQFAHPCSPAVQLIQITLFTNIFITELVICSAMMQMYTLLPFSELSFCIGCMWVNWIYWGNRFILCRLYFSTMVPHYHYGHLDGPFPGPIIS